MDLPASHVDRALFVLGGPLKKYLVLIVHIAAGREAVAKSGAFASLQTLQANLSGSEDKDRQIYPWNDDIAPTAERAGQNPAPVRIERIKQQALPLQLLARYLVGRIGRPPEEIIGVEETNAG